MALTLIVNPVKTEAQGASKTATKVKEQSSVIVIIELYKSAKNKGTESPWGHSEQKGSLPIKGEKGFTSKDQVKDGKVIQRRYYDGEGKADMDIDYTDHGNPKQHPKVPHRHDWDWSSGSPERGSGY
ncbi:hypothetical protein ACLMAB_05740 [Brevibacillus laterosporus]